jgi:hypothetical protein
MRRAGFEPAKNVQRSVVYHAPPLAFIPQVTLARQHAGRDLKVTHNQPQQATAITIIFVRPVGTDAPAEKFSASALPFGYGCKCGHINPVLLLTNSRAHVPMIS